MKYQIEAKKFLEEIGEKDEILIIFNNDGDGICSCTLLMKFLELTKRKKPYIIAQPIPMEKNIVQKIKSTFPKKIIFLDIVVDQQEDIIKKIRSFADILIIDHHQINKNLNTRHGDHASVVHFNPRFTDKDVYQSTSYCVYKLCSELMNMADFLWMAGVGMVSDYNLDNSKDLVAEVKKKYKIETDLYASFFGRIADMVSASHATGLLSCEEIAELFMRIDDPKNIENARGGDKLIRSYQEIENEMLSIMGDSERNAEVSGKIVLYNLKSKYKLISPVSTKISEKYRDRLVLIYSKSGNKIKVSARNQKKNINAGKIMKFAASGLKASGGGHEAAAGATVDEKDWDKFIEKVKELVNK
jgi:single-stranded DNA-specific DHH superfamily exonuclease